MATQVKSTTRLCSLCGRPIAPARLEALPAARRCIDCA
jgi:RNA polymerase-binding transcription factor DksA